MKAEVDKDACISCGVCMGIASDVFVMDDDGKSEALDTVTDENKDSVQEAIDSCPTNAIAWEE